MCIRDSVRSPVCKLRKLSFFSKGFLIAAWTEVAAIGSVSNCLLYTSDAADERSSVDLGGRRIIKKKTKEDNSIRQMYKKESQTSRYS